jgi:hypothetical protein
VTTLSTFREASYTSQTEDSDNFAELAPSTKPLLIAGMMSHPDYGYSQIKLPNYNDILGIKPANRKL